MHSIAHYAAGIIIASALGAFVLCLLVIRYGFTPADDEPLPVRHRRFFVTRLGHAAGAVCFAITASLGGVALSLASRTPAPVAPVARAPAVDIGPLEAGQTRLAHDLRSLDERIERAEAALAELRTASAAPPPRRAVVAERAPRAVRRAPATTDFSDAASPRTAVAAERAERPEGAAPVEMRGTTGDGFRNAAHVAARLGREVVVKAQRGVRAVRDFFRDL
jgi:hypothetical protein